MNLESVLLIDDDFINNYINEKLFNKLKVAREVITKKNGLEALNYLKECMKGNSPFPSLILLDINMPVMNGFEFLQNFKGLHLGKNENVKIVMLSTSDHPKDMNILPNFEIYDFIKKPLTQKKIFEILKRLFTNTRGEQLAVYN